MPRRTAPCPQLEVQKQPLPFPRPPVCVPYLQIGRGAKGRGRAPSHSHGPDSRSPERANGGGGRKKGGGRFRVCARATARVHPYGWHPLPIPARPPPGSHVAPTRNSEGSEQPGLGAASVHSTPLRANGGGGAASVSSLRANQGGHALLVCTRPPFACPLCTQTEAGRKRVHPFPPPHSRVAPARKSRVGGAASECARGPLLTCHLCTREVGGGEMGGAPSHSRAGPVRLLLLRANWSGGAKGG